jgi:hypothetical protein
MFLKFKVRVKGKAKWGNALKKNENLADNMVNARNHESIA